MAPTQVAKAAGGWQAGAISTGLSTCNELQGLARWKELASRTQVYGKQKITKVPFTRLFLALVEVATFLAENALNPG